MAYSKIYTRVSWVNEPSTATPINDNNLNNMDAAIDTLDSRIVNLDGRLETLEGYEPRVIEYATEAENSKLDSEAYAVGKRDGSDVTPGDVAYQNNAKYYAESAGASATSASTSESNAGDYASDSEAYAVGKRGGVDVPSSDVAYHNNAKYYSDSAAASETNANTSMVSARQSAENADTSARSASLSETNASVSEVNAGVSELNASDSATSANDSRLDSEAWAKGTRDGVEVESTDPAYHNNSKYYSEQIGTEVEDAARYAQNALESSEDSEAWAVGTRNGAEVPSTDETYHNNAKYYAEQASAIVGVEVMQGATATSDGRSGLVPQPLRGDQDKVLFGDGTFKEVKSSALLIDNGYVAIDYSVLNA